MSGTPGTPFDPGRPGDPTHGTPPGTRPDPGTPGTDPGMPGKDPGEGQPKDPPGTFRPGIPGLPTPEEIRRCLCQCVPISCEAMLGAAKALLLIGIALGYVTLMLAPPDWWARSLIQVAVQGSSDAARIARVTSAAGTGGATGGAPVSAVAGAAGGGAGGAAVGGPVGAGIGAAGGGLAAGTAGAASGASGAASAVLSSELADRGFWRTLEAVVRITDALIMWIGMAILLLSQVVLLLALFLFLVWFVCCAKGEWCRLIANLCWVLEAALIVVLPIIGTVLGFGLALFMVFEVPAASRAGLPFLMSLFGGLLLGTIIYGVLRWLRDVRRCPVLVLWQWPWTEERAS